MDIHDTMRQWPSDPLPEDDAQADSAGDMDTPWQGQDTSGTASKPASPSGNQRWGDTIPKPHIPVQKRRRVTRACDECRRKKIKCDGKQPCTHCTVYSYECSYDQPSNRRRNPLPQYIEALENRLQKAESILRTVLPGVDLDDPKYEARGVEQIIESSKTTDAAPAAKSESADEDARMESMVEQAGSLVLDDQGHWSFHGHSSGFAFMRKFKAQFGDSISPEPRLPWTLGEKFRRPTPHLFESPKSAASSTCELNGSPRSDLPSKEVAIELCRNALDDCCALMRLLHRPTFFKKLHYVYDSNVDRDPDIENHFLPLLFVVMGVGCLFSRTGHDNTMLDVKGYQEAIEQGYQYFDAGRQMLDITDCRDLTTLQTVVFMIIFLQSAANLSTCYAYLGIALRACCRLGLHRNVNANFNPIEREERKRVFWLVRKMDTYVGAALGLPQMLSDEDIDQDLPTEVDDDYITEQGIKQMPPQVFPLLKATNAHTRLTSILKKVVRTIYPIKGSGNMHPGERYSIAHVKIREIERDLQAWMDDLPNELRPSDNAGKELSRVQQLLRISYAHVQMMMYRPFLHYVSQAGEAKHVDKRSFASAAACVSVARNIVHITTEMKKRGLLVGAYWFVMYTTYFAILSLVFFVLENPESPTGREILKDAMEGRDTLAGLAKRSLAADRCSLSLTTLFESLPSKLKERRTSLQSTPISASRKRHQPTSDPAGIQGNHSAPNVVLAREFGENAPTPHRSRTLPHDLLVKVAKRNSMPTPSSTPSVDFANGFMNRPANSQSASTFDPSPTNTPPNAALIEAQHQLGNSNLPDLKNVMFLSDNPFAYPVQPMSALEDAQLMTPEQPQDSFSAGLNDGDLFNLPNTARSARLPHDQLFNSINMPMFSDGGPQQFLQHQPERQFSVPVRISQNFGMMPMEEPGTVTGPQAPQEDYWSQVNKGHVRTGLTPGGVNLDELFGAEGWNSIWNEQSFPRP